MTKQSSNSFKDKIIGEMLVDYSSALEKNFDIAKKLIRITKDGKVDLLQKDRLIGKDKILLYLIGKLYAKEVGFSETGEVGNEELLVELGIPQGSLLPWLKALRDEKMLKTIERGKLSYHLIAPNMVERILNSVTQKLSKGEKTNAKE